jgi:hypothetical protein
MVSMPVGFAALPGASVPPLMIEVVAGSTTPVPLKVPPELTVTLDERAIEPSTSSVPPLTVVEPVYVLSVPVRT